MGFPTRTNSPATPSLSSEDAKNALQFNLIANAELTGGKSLKKIENSNFRLRIERLAWEKSGSIQGQNKFIAEFTVVLTDHPYTKPGEAIGWAQVTQGSGWEGRILKFLLAAAGVSSNDTEAVEAARPHFAAELAEAVGETNKYQGVEILAATGSKGKAKNGFDFIPVDFAPV